MNLVSCIIFILCLDTILDSFIMSAFCKQFFLWYLKYRGMVITVIIDMIRGRLERYLYAVHLYWGDRTHFVHTPNCIDTKKFISADEPFLRLVQCLLQLNQYYWNQGIGIWIKKKKTRSCLKPLHWGRYCLHHTVRYFML